MNRKWSTVDDDRDALAHARIIVVTIEKQDVQVPFTREQMKQIAIRAENIARWARREMRES
jgi:hypothetical protein